MKPRSKRNRHQHYGHRRERTLPVPESDRALSAVSLSQRNRKKQPTSKKPTPAREKKSILIPKRASPLLVQTRSLLRGAVAGDGDGQKLRLLQIKTMWPMAVEEKSTGSRNRRRPDKHDPT